MRTIILNWFKKVVKEEEIRNKDIVEVGSYNVNGTIKDIITQYKPYSYIGIDERPGPNVDFVMKAEQLSIINEDFFDVAISTDTLEHILDWRTVVNVIKFVIKPGGLIFLAVPDHTFGRHEYPRDCWRFELEDMKKIFADFEILELVNEDQETMIKARKPQKVDLSKIEVFSMDGH